MSRCGHLAAGRMTKTGSVRVAVSATFGAGAAVVSRALILVSVTAAMLDERHHGAATGGARARSRGGGSLRADAWVEHPGRRQALRRAGRYRAPAGEAHAR